jgi:hypothetical protein
MHLPSPVRLLGIDLGVISDHTAVVVDGTGRVHARRRARSTVTSLAALEAAALATAEAGTHLSWSSSRPGRRGVRWRCSTAAAATPCCG